MSLSVLICSAVIVVCQPSQKCLYNSLTICVGLAFGIICAMLQFGSIPFTQIYVPEVPKRYANVHWDTNRSVAQHMKREIRILCWVMTGPENHKIKAQHIRYTWGRHCNTLLFMSSVEDPELVNSIPLPVEENRDYLWAKTKEAFRYIYDKHRDEADWFLKADDDSYVIMENLRSMLHPYSPELPIFFGRKFKLEHFAPKQGYMSGGAGYVLSKKAMVRLVEDGLDNATICYEGHGNAEDIEMGNCMDHLGIVAGDSRDSNGKDRFFPFDMNTHLYMPNPPEKDYWYFTYSYYYPIDGPDAVPANAVSFHYVDTKWMYMYDYLIYDVRTYGRGQYGIPIDERKFTLDEVKANLKLAEAKKT